MHNEIYFLPAFLEHYRNLGVQHFALLDDRSDDGSTEYAVAQSDVTVFQSDVRYGTECSWVRNGKRYTKRAMIYWRQSLLDAVGDGKWSIHADLDEFLDLPEGETLPTLAQKATQSDCVAALIWGVMIDLYPENLAALSGMSGDARQDFRQPWYFDGQRHLIYRKNTKPVAVYNGSRARLLHRHDLIAGQEKWSRRLRRVLFGTKYPFAGTIRKPIMVKWNASANIEHSHTITASNPSTQSFLFATTNSHRHWQQR